MRVVGYTRSPNLGLPKRAVKEGETDKEGSKEFSRLRYDVVNPWLRDCTGTTEQREEKKEGSLSKANRRNPNIQTRKIFPRGSADPLFCIYRRTPNVLAYPPPLALAPVRHVLPPRTTRETGTTPPDCIRCSTPGVDRVPPPVGSERLGFAGLGCIAGGLQPRKEKDRRIDPHLPGTEQHTPSWRAEP